MSKNSIPADEADDDESKDEICDDKDTKKYNKERTRFKS
jgi:hypothetical protein